MKLPLAALLSLLLCVPGSALAAEAGALLLPPGESGPEPRQRGLNEIDDLPVRDAACPACSFAVAVPEVNKLMRRAPGAAEADAPKWRLHAQSRDADLCPYPGRGKVSFQADLVICPSCGYAARADAFADPVSAETAAWVAATLRPNLRAALSALLGRRAGEMSEDEVTAFFNRQSEIPDILRTEHARIRSLAARVPKKDQAEATWRAAWAMRRELVRPPRGDFLSKRAAGAESELAKVKRRKPGLAGDIEGVKHLMGRTRSGKDRLPAADRYAARLLLAGMYSREGRFQEAEKELMALQQLCRERFLRADQDPLWPATSSRASREYRLAELETMRTEAEREVAVRLELLKGEQALLEQAATLLREALAAGEFDGDAESALFHSYLVGEFLRRTGHFPLAAEWFKNLINLAPEDAAVGQAARAQLELLREQAGDQVNLLSALGQDGELFAKLREICKVGR